MLLPAGSSPRATRNASRCQWSKIGQVSMSSTNQLVITKVIEEKSPKMDLVIPNSSGNIIILVNGNHSDAHHVIHTIWMATCGVCPIAPLFTQLSTHRRKYRRWDPERSTLDPRHTRWSKRGGCGDWLSLQPQKVGRVLRNPMCQWEFQDPKMVGTSNLGSWNGHWMWEKSWDRERPAASKSDHLMSGRRNEPIDDSEQLRNTPQHRWFRAQGQDTLFCFY